MGLLKAGLGAAGGVMADQWKEFIYCESMPADVLACKGSKRTGGRSSNTRGEDNVISNGSVIAVNDGQGMLVVQNGKIIEVALEPGEFVFDTGSEPSVFSGNLGDSIKETFANIGSRFTFGGDAGKDQRVYFINTKEIIGNKYGTASPVPFRVVDNNIGLDVDISVRCNGEYSYRITNPLLFYTNVCGNVTDSYTRDKIDSQLKSELLTALQPAFAKISEMGIRYSAIPGHTTELARALNEVLSADWRDLRGVEIVSFGVNSIAASQEDEQMIKDLQKEYHYTIVFITHDLGVVANIADRVAVLYAGQIIELATVEELFYDPRHPYTWALLSSLPQLAERNTKLYSITGTPPSLYNKIVGDSFAPRNPYCLKIDTLAEPPMFKVTETHYAKTWLLEPNAPKVEKPEIIQDIHEKLLRAYNI